MSGLEDTYREGGRWRTVARATLLLVGGPVATVGFVAATASLVAGFGLAKSDAIEVAALVGGVLLLAVFLVLFTRAAVADGRHTVVGVGTAAALAGLALFWTALPAGWTGDLGRLPAAALGAYAAGLLAVFAAGFSADTSARQRGGSNRDEIGSVEPTMTTDDDGTGDVATAPSAVGDGGEADDDLRFFDDDS